MTLNDTPRGNRIHIGIFGQRNAGKSSLINALTGQRLAIVSQTPGTTADPVFKSMELHPIGPVVFIDTAGFDDDGELGALRTAKTEETVAQTDVAILVLDGTELAGSAALKYAAAAVRASDAMPADPLALQQQWARKLQEAEIPVITVINKWDQLNEAGKSAVHAMARKIAGGAAEGSDPIPVSAKNGEGMDMLRDAIAAASPQERLQDRMTEGLIEEDGLALLVMPQNIQAPKGRLILPQVQTIRELLDRGCTVVSTTLGGLSRSLETLGRAPDLIITDSQCFKEVYGKKPEQSRLTSFSILMAASKGDIGIFVDGVSAIDDAKAGEPTAAKTWEPTVAKTGSPAAANTGEPTAAKTGSPVATNTGGYGVPFRVLIAEACTHVPQTEDIGTVKIPRLLKREFGERVEITGVRGKDFPEEDDLKNYDLIIHCGACMFNRRMVMGRIAAAQRAGVPITNYGVFLAKMSGILDKVSLPAGNKRRKEDSNE
ncbi:MAG: 50S ribosome-binding GTPase [Firmicutes bacterium]|nr:50S ribosome-binding GTPase [Bacillota bacterium]